MPGNPLTTACGPRSVRSRPSSDRPWLTTMWSACRTRRLPQSSAGRPTPPDAPPMTGFALSGAQLPQLRIRHTAEGIPLMINSNDPVLAPIGADEAQTMTRLRDQLVAAAEADRLLDIAYRTVDSPVGTLLLAATDQGLVRVAYEQQDHDHVLQGLSELISPRILRAPRRLDQVARQLAEYFAGERRDFVLPLDFRLSHGFRRAVLGHLGLINYGHTESYAEVAAATGHARAVRAVGTACATNPLPVVVPCHRVLRSDGKLGGYAGGLEVKAALLSLEAGGPIAGDTLSR